MYKVVVNVSGKRARVVPKAHRLLVAEREFAKLSQDDALANKDGLTDAVRGLLTDRGLADAHLYSVELPDELSATANGRVLPDEKDDSEKATEAKGPVTKPVNPKEGEKGSPTNQPETQEAANQASGAQPSETTPKAPNTSETTDKK